MKLLQKLFAFGLILLNVQSCKKEKETEPIPVTNYKVKSFVTTDGQGVTNTTTLTYNSDNLLSTLNSTEGFSYNFNWASDKLTWSNNLGETDICLRNSSGYIITSDSGKTQYTYDSDNKLIKSTSPTDTTIYTWINGNLTNVKYNGVITQMYEYSTEINNMDMGLKYAQVFDDVEMSSKNLVSKYTYVSTPNLVINFNYTKDDKGRVKTRVLSGGQTQTQSYTYFD